MPKIEFQDYQLPKYKYVKNFHEGLAVVQNYEGKYGYIDQTGKEVISCQFSYADDFEDGLAMISENGECGFIDRSGKIVIATVYFRVSNFYDGLACAQYRTGKWGYMDRRGNEVVPCIYLNTYPFADGFGVV